MVESNIPKLHRLTPGANVYELSAHGEDMLLSVFETENLSSEPVYVTLYLDALTPFPPPFGTPPQWLFKLDPGGSRNMPLSTPVVLASGAYIIASLSSDENIPFTDGTVSVNYCLKN